MAASALLVALSIGMVFANVVSFIAIGIVARLLQPMSLLSGLVDYSYRPTAILATSSVLLVAAVFTVVEAVFWAWSARGGSAAVANGTRLKGLRSPKKHAVILFCLTILWLVGVLGTTVVAVVRSPAQDTASNGGSVNGVGGYISTYFETMFSYTEVPITTVTSLDRFTDMTFTNTLTEYTMSRTAYSTDTLLWTYYGNYGGMNGAAIRTADNSKVTSAAPTSTLAPRVPASQPTPAPRVLVRKHEDRKRIREARLSQEQAMQREAKLAQERAIHDKHDQRALRRGTPGKIEARHVLKGRTGPRYAAYTQYGYSTGYEPTGGFTYLADPIVLATVIIGWIGFALVASLALPHMIFSLMAPSDNSAAPSAPYLAAQQSAAPYMVAQQPGAPYMVAQQSGAPYMAAQQSAALSGYPANAGHLANANASSSQNAHPGAPVSS